jgi:NAD+ synthase
MNAHPLVSGIVAWLREYSARAGARGYVVGLSGGVDSACVAALCQRAVGDGVLALWLPCHSSAEDARMSELVARAFGLRCESVDLGPAYDALAAALPAGVTDMARANLKPRLRMAAWYAVAQTHGYLVAGGGNKTEIRVGYFTKYGDAGVDVLPLGDLYKCQVRELARELGVPQPVIDRAPTAGLWAGQTDEGEMGISYAQLDAVLMAMDAGSAEAIEPALLDKVQRMVACTDHKRALPPAFRANLFLQGAQR